MANQGQSSSFFGSEHIAGIVAAYPTAPQSFEVLRRNIEDTEDVIDAYRAMADEVINATYDGRKELHLQLRSYLLQKGVNVSSALLENFCEWVDFNNELDETMYWFYEHEKHLYLRLEELKDHEAAFTVFWKIHAGLTMGTNSREELGVYAAIISKQSLRLDIIHGVITYCHARMDGLCRMPKWLYWTDIEVPEDAVVSALTMREMQVSDFL